MALILSLGKIDLSLLKDEFGKIQTELYALKIRII